MTRLSGQTSYQVASPGSPFREPVMTNHRLGSPLRYVVRGVLAVGLLVSQRPGSSSQAGERMETFDRDPGWEAQNNRAKSIPARVVRQDFGFSPGTHHAGGRGVGEPGGVISPAAESAYFAKRISPLTLRDRLTASGTLALGGGPVHALVGFFNAATVNEWRTPNTVALRIQGRGDRFFAYV